MYIKQLTIHGFKSYRDETIFGPFSPYHNVIVGRNGSGKSNFFAAIRFVLHDAYTKLGQEERQALLHEGGTVHLSAYVEIVFDNSDGRFPTGKETTTIRRTVGLKKDEYSVDGKSSNKTDVMNLLQSAGFSKSNPYYIVPQGRVTALTNAKDEERLALFKEVAGTRTYEEHRQESLKILEETSSKREKISELLVFIEERLTELDEEKEELKGYQEKEKERRTLEYVLQHRELVEVGDELEKLEADNTDLINNNMSNLATFDDLMEQIGQFESHLITMKESLRQKEDALSVDEELLRSNLQDKSRLELAHEDLSKKYQNCLAEEETCRRQLDKIMADINFKEDALANLIPTLRQFKGEQINLQSLLNELDGRKELLIAKQGRSVQFRSASDRDRWVKKEIDTLRETLQLHQKQSNTISDEISTAEIKKSDLVKSIEAMVQSESNLNADLSNLDDRMYSIRQIRDQLTEQRKELWRAEHKLEGSINTLKEEAARCERSLMVSMEKGTTQGLDAVKRISKQLNLSGVYGPLYELFEVDEIYSIATETIAGSSLFHVVVDSDATASKLLEIMIKEKSGRVTFMPLNRLRPSRVNYPDNSTQSIPLIDQLRFNSELEPAMRQVFGKTVLCEDLGKGASIARQFGLTAVTLNGDRADKKGALTGGFMESNKSKLDLVQKWKSWSAKLEEHQLLLYQVQCKLRDIEPQLSGHVCELESLECRRQELSKNGISELELRRRELSSIEELIELKEKSRLNCLSQIKTLQSQITSLTGELGTPLTSKLTLEEQSNLTNLTKESEQFRTQLNNLNKEVSRLGNEVTSLESELDLSLRRKRNQLTIQLAKINTVSIQRELKLSEQELANLDLTLENIQTSINTNTLDIKSLSSDIGNLQSALDKARVNYDEALRSNTHKSNNMERYLAKRMDLISRRESLQGKIRELSVAPDSFYESLRDTPTKLLLGNLSKVNEDLRTRFAHVNKKAQEQYNTFHKQGDALRERQNELESSAKAIDDFIRVLDRRKEEAIERTFQQVAKGFAEIFERLVPLGRGELIMSSNLRLDDSMEVDGEDESELGFTGVAIKVSFNSKSDEGLLMSQLSGGQKSLVALALIFAIQRCDPAPFYLFDEIDANLDSAYRSSVAHLIGEMKKENIQFITTTFRPELLEDSELYFGVSFGGRVSRVEQITREQALQFVELEPIKP